MIEQHQAREAQFDSQYQEYRDICKQISNILDEFKELEERWKNETQPALSAKYEQEIEQLYRAKHAVWLVSAVVRHIPIMRQLLD
jgi:tRNA A37 N6-isopentenylltransferase MiaA